MAGNQKKILITMLIACLILLPLTGCFMFGGQTVNVDPGSGDADVDDAGHAEDDTDDAEHAADDVDEAEHEEKDTDAGGAEETFLEHDDVRLYYDPQLVLDVDPMSETIPAASGDEMYTPAQPEIIHFNLDMEQAQVYITPVAKYENAADFAPGIIADLQRMIEGMDMADGCVPELPLNTFYHVCDHQQLTSNYKKVDFMNGSGVRFVSVYGIQDLVPVDNENLRYVFQGLTDDGKYFVKIIVRILHAQLPDTGEIPADIYAGDYETVHEYFADFETTLNNSKADFSPKLDWIDAFLASFKVE